MLRCKLFRRLKMLSDNDNVFESRAESAKFTMILNEAIRDSRLSWRAKGILAGCLSHASGFKFNKAWIMKHGTEGRDAVTAALAELREFGYLEDKVLRCEKTGRVLSRELTFRDRPTVRLETRLTGNQATGNPSYGKPVALRRPINPEDQLKENQLEENPPVSPRKLPAPPTPSSPGSGTKRVKATQSSVPDDLRPLSELICSFFNEHKAGAKTQRAFAGLILQLRKILQDKSGGIQHVKKQLQTAIEKSQMGEKKWSCITYENWERFGKQKTPAWQINNRPSTQAFTTIFEEDAASDLQF